MSQETIIKLNIEQKPENLNPRQIRANGFLPVTIYGKGMESKSFQLNTHEFKMAYKNNADAIFELSNGNETYKVKVQEAQLNYSTNDILNVEFRLV